MKQVEGLWLPAHEEHLIEWMRHPKNKELVDGKPAYQMRKQRLAMSFVKQFRVAVDIGAHCGLWSMHLVKKFQRLHAFEPVALHRECFARNVPADGGEVKLEACALGEKAGSCSMHTKQTSSGDSWVEGEGEIPIRRLDEFELQDVDFMKLDCEGYELLALRGAEETLKRCRPTIIVEQKPGRAVKFGLPEIGAVDYLRSLGAKLREKTSGDFILTWD